MRQSPTRQTLRLILLGVVVWCAGTASSAQAPAGTAASPPSPKDAVPVFRSRSDLVVLHVNVFSGRSGVVSDQSELARLAQVTQPRMTQIMNLLHLAADIQEQILFLPPVLKGNDPIHEKMLRPLTAQIDWRRQREMWRDAAPSGKAQNRG